MNKTEIVVPAKAAPVCWWCDAHAERRSRLDQIDYCEKHFKQPLQVTFEEFPEKAVQFRKLVNWRGGSR